MEKDIALENITAKEFWGESKLDIPEIFDNTLVVIVVNYKKYWDGWNTSPPPLQEYFNSISVCLAFLFYEWED